MMEKKIIQITRIIVKERIKYVVPTRFTTSTKLIYIDELGEHHKYYNEKMNNYNKFINWVKQKFGDSYDYIVNKDKPYIHYL